MMAPAAEKFSSRLRDIREAAKAGGVKDDDFKKMMRMSYSTLAAEQTKASTKRKRMITYAVASILVAVMAYFYYETMDPRCLVSNNLLLLELSRPAVKCDVCKSITEIPTINGDDMTKELFLNNYAYNGVPLLVKGGAKNWTALYIFSYDYLKDLYVNTEGALDAIENDCQFFPYQTDFNTMGEVFNMTTERSRIDSGEKEWYVGWSNCHSEVTRNLRRHYQRPAFLPDNSESSNLDWLFMGGFGSGADVHIDFVQRPSWQAMITGKKSWRIIPSPECEHVCSEMNATMEKGDIILVDTNMWYHSTYIHPGEVSITIGSEYD